MRTRFAPSPTGPLHLGHAYSAMLAHDMARAAGGDFLLRIEDIDRARSRDVWEAAIFDDLSWLGLTWETPVMRQSERLDTYGRVIRSLWNRGLLFACACTRRDVISAASAPNEGDPPMGPDGVVYPGTCRFRRKSPDLPDPPGGMALRLDMEAAAGHAGDVAFEDTGERNGTHAVSAGHLVEAVGDVVIARRDMGTSYHLSVVVDDADQAITHVVRGLDLFDATAIHVVLQRLLALSTPIYHHHALIRDASGKRLAKRDDARAIGRYRDEGRTPADIRRMVGL